MPKEYLDSIRGLIHKLIVPFNGGAYTYESLVCWTKLFSIKPSLKDLWAYNAALLAARSPILHSRLNYWKLPKLEVVISKSISNHRDAAAVDFWRGRHAFDGTLIPLSDFSSPFLYNSLVEDEYLDTAMNHTGNKISKFLARKSLFAATDAEGCMLALAHNMALARKVPRPYTVYHFTLVNNAVATERRKRHQFGVERQRVAFCRTVALMMSPLNTGWNGVALSGERGPLFSPGSESPMGPRKIHSLSLTLCLIISPLYYYGCSCPQLCYLEL